NKSNTELSDGSLVRIYSHSGKFLAIGHYQSSSIAVRILSFEDKLINADFFMGKLLQALDRRVSGGLVISSDNNCFRWINGEGDGLPGLIIDKYGELIVVQFHSLGMFVQRADILSAINAVNTTSQSVFFSFPDSYRREQLAEDIGYQQGLAKVHYVNENGMQFLVDPEKGQKTGFFLDQRDNREYLSKIAKGKKILNAFSYSGGFSVAALKGGADLVHSVDVSPYACDLCEQHLKMNGFDPASNQVFTADVMDFLKKSEVSYDIVILDPPAFAKSRKKSHNAVQAYKRLNMLGIKKVNRGGLLLTFSCSQVVSRQLFEDTIRAAGIESNKSVHILKTLSAGIDHPVDLFHTEGHYLKGLVLEVN
ncbi:MAG: class I SAM-dependent rRNA methyltransferase, partial [Saprospirales bacterium]